MKNFYRKSIINFVTCLICVLISACSFEARTIKNEILKASPKTKNTIVKVDLAQFSKKKLLKMCIQTPYITKKLMEERVGEDLRNFSEVDDKYFVLWLFYDQNPPVQIKFKISKGLYFNLTQSSCSNSPIILLSNSVLQLNQI
ncbi:MAG: hypothetical protein V4629_04975 [Pseudomonadota bacterium]